MNRILTLIIAATAISGCADQGIEPELARRFTFDNRISLVIPAKWIGPTYSTFEYRTVIFQWLGAPGNPMSAGTFYIRRGLAIEYPYYLNSLNATQTEKIIDQRRVIEFLWSTQSDDGTTYNLYLLVIEPDEDYSRYALVCYCHSFEDREQVRIIIERMRFLRPQIGT